ncbi:MAG: regulatory protein RecX [Bacillota bacterium]
MVSGKFEKARDYACRLLSRCGRSEQELAGRLRDKGFEPDVVADVLAHLRSYGFIDDLSLAREWVRQRLDRRPAGRVLLVWELRRRGFESDVVEAALAGFGVEEEYTAALELARRKMERRGPGYMKRLPAFLHSRGFQYETVRRVCCRLSGHCVLCQD